MLAHLCRHRNHIWKFRAAPKLPWFGVFSEAEEAEQDEDVNDDTDEDEHLVDVGAHEWARELV